MHTHIYRHILSTLAALALLTACTGDTPSIDSVHPGHVLIEIDQAEYKLNKAEGAAATITVKSTGRWKIVCESNDDSAFTLSKKEGDGDATVTVSAKANTRTAERQAKYFIQELRTGYKRRFTVTQAAGDVTLTLVYEGIDNGTVTFSGNGTFERAKIIVKSNVKSTVEILEEDKAWFRVTKTELNSYWSTGDAFEIATNDREIPITTDQTGTVIVTAGSGSAQQQARINVVRKAIDPSITIGPNYDGVSYDGGTLTFNVTANAPWKATALTSTWLNFKPNTIPTGTGDAKINIVVEANTDTVARETEVRVEVTQNATIFATATIRQQAATLPTLSAHSIVDATRTTVTLRYTTTSTTFPVTRTWLSYTPVDNENDEPAATIKLATRAASNPKAEDITITLTNLETGTWYYAVLHTQNEVGIVDSEPFWFRTLSAPDHGDNPLPDQP